MGYPYKDIEQKWQEYWESRKTFRTPEADTAKEKFYVLDMFPYPSGAGLHVGHPEGYTATDIIARYKRMRGVNVLHPMGWDAYGLPAEQYAIETGTHPRITTENNIKRFRGQLKALGFSYDWDRQVDTTDPDYYKWTQWIFLQLYKKGLAYLAEVPVNWCPALGTVLANEEVIDGLSERGSHPVYRRPMKQWMLKITAYADRLLASLDDLDWPDSTKEMQRNWIGRSEGAEVDFPLPNSDDKIRVFTTRPDTLFGATYMVLAPEHSLVQSITSDAQHEAVEAYIKAASRKSDLERTELQKTKTGVFTGGYAINPVNGEQIPVWIADYVLATYGTGAIMAVPGHDERDYEFAKKFDLPILEVIAGGDISEAAYISKDGILVNSANENFSINGLKATEAITKIIDWLEAEGIGQRQINYKLRDWLFSRQRYWGEPFPILHGEDGDILPVDEAELPLSLPEMEDYKPMPIDDDETDPQPPLSRGKDSWKYVTINGKKYTREFNTMPQWAGSCWYYLRYVDPRNNDQIFDPAAEKYWMNVDLYVGGAEHSVLHLLYARFWHKVLFDIGIVSTDEPFKKLIHQGMILGEMEYTLYSDASGNPVSLETVEKASDYTARKLSDSEVEKKGDGFVWKENPAIRVDGKAHKMSKSRGNVINPDDIIESYGADSLRLYEMFMGPLEQQKSWSMKGVDGVNRFLNRAWRLMVDEFSGELLDQVDENDATPEQLRQLHLTIKKVTEDIENMRFNTAIAQMMVFVNEANKWTQRPRSVMEQFILLLSPFAPHLCEELWQMLGNENTLAYEDWPVYDEKHLVEDTKEVVIQINGKVRYKLELPAELSREDTEKQAMAAERVQELIAGKTVIKVIVVPNRLVNIVAR